MNVYFPDAGIVIEDSHPAPEGGELDPHPMNSDSRRNPARRKIEKIIEGFLDVKDIRVFNESDFYKEFFNIYYEYGDDGEFLQSFASLLAGMLSFVKKSFVGMDKSYEGVNPSHLLKDFEDEFSCIFDYPLGDHPRTIKIKGRSYQELHPYRLWLKDLEALVKFCKEKGYSVMIDGDSDYFPGQSILVRFKKDDEKGE